MLLLSSCCHETKIVLHAADETLILSELSSSSQSLVFSFPFPVGFMTMPLFKNLNPARDK
jgi:hypothetical protein